MKDVQELDDLSCCELSQGAYVERSPDKKDEVTGWVRKGAPDENHDTQWSCNQVAEKDDEAEVRQKLVDQGPENQKKSASHEFDLP